MASSEEEAEALLARQVVYDGEDYTRRSIETMVEDASVKQQASLKTLEDLGRAHEQVSQEMTADLERDRGALARVLGKIPVVRRLVPERPLHLLLTEKLEVAQRRTQEVGNYLDRIQVEIKALQEDVTRLNGNMVSAAHNEEAAARFVLELRNALEAAERAREQLGDEGSAPARELSARIDALKHRIWEHGAKLRLFSTAENRLAGIIRMNNHFLEILRNLHTNMHTLYEAGNEVLGELGGNLAALASAARASELSMDMQRAMESLRTSVNKVAVLASETSLYLTQNVDKLVKEMRVYDEATERLVEANLRAEREEQRINETIALAERELAELRGAKAG